MGVHLDVRNGCLDLRHVAVGAFTPGRAGLMVCVFFQRRRARAIRRSPDGRDTSGRSSLAGRRSCARSSRDAVDIVAIETR